MALWDKILGELVDIIEWLDDTHDTLTYRFERYQNEIKYGAKLVVREGQMAAFVNEGRLADVFKPGTYTLTTQNLPVLVDAARAGSTGSTARSRPRCTSSRRASSPTSSGARRDRR